MRPPDTPPVIYDMKHLDGRQAMWQLKLWVAWTALPFILPGAIFIFAGGRTGPESKTDDGHSLKWFWYVMGAWFIGLTVLIYAGIFFFVGRQSRNADRLGSSGLHGFATVMSSGAAGSELNNMPRIEMELEVKPEGVPACTVTRREYVNPVNLAAVRSGNRLPVLEDPGNHRKLIMAWGLRPGP